MLLNAYTLYDVKSLTYSPPFYAGAHGAASRMVADLAQDSSTTVGRHPKDFTLYCVGLFNDGTGELLPHAVKELVTDVVSLLPRTVQRDFFADPPVNANGADIQPRDA